MFSWVTEGKLVSLFDKPQPEGHNTMNVDFSCEEAGGSRREGISSQSFRKCPGRLVLLREGVLTMTGSCFSVLPLHPTAVCHTPVPARTLLALLCSSTPLLRFHCDLHQRKPILGWTLGLMACLCYFSVAVTKHYYKGDL